MDWHSRFKAEFFRQWRLANLPAPEPHENAYRASLRSSVPPALGRRSKAPPLDPALVTSVYGFGVFTGNLLGRLLGVGERPRKARADWCGRFNLGISLFDYVCDEGPGAQRALSLPAFRPFVARAPRFAVEPILEPGAVERALDLVATGVLRDLTAEIGPDAARGRSRGLWRALHALFLAQMTATDAGAGATRDPAAATRVSRTKSVEPFRVMAEWMALDPRLDARRLARARALGRAVGTVVWVVDDAKDVWRDLEAGRPNLFLLRAALAEPALFRQGASGTTRDGLFDLRLIQTWERTRAISTVCRRSVRTLRSAATRTRAPAAARRELLGQLGAALACW